MKWIIVLTFLTIPFVQASMEEEAVVLNSEMELLKESAKNPKVLMARPLSPRWQRNGGNITPQNGIEDIEQRYFQDDVSVQSARSLQDDELPSEKQELDEFRNLEKSSRVDGTVPALHQKNIQ